MGALPRYLPDEPLPPYAYLSGRSPHPTRDPGGHAFGREAPPPTPPDPVRWRGCRPYLRGVDLYNHGYHWEAHEAWESLWHASGRSGPVADFLRALIRLAAAGFKAREGRPRGTARHAAAAAALLRGVAAATAPAMGPAARPAAASAAAPAAADAAASRFMGLPLQELAGAADALAAAPLAAPLPTLRPD